MARRRENESGGRETSPAARGKRPRKRALLARLVLVSLVLLVPLLAVALAMAGLFYYYGSDPNLPSLSGIGDYRPPQITKVLDRDGNVIGEIGTIHRTVVPYAKIPKVMVQALLAAEDAEYFEHEGIDYKGMVRAFVENVVRRKFAQGASTITQQVVKQMLLTPEKSLRRKVQEIILARRLSQRFSKEDVLSIYLNQMYFGHGRYGVEEATRYFFGKSIADVDVGEAALLAGLVQSPERLSPYKHPDAAKKRQTYVLGQMAKLDYVYEDVAKKIAAAPIAVIPEGASAPSLAPEAVDAIRKILEAKFGADKLATLGLEVKTTIDSKMQVLARQALERGLEEVDQRHGFRGPLARLSGKQLDKRRAELKAERKKPIDRKRCRRGHRRAGRQGHRRTQSKSSLRSFSATPAGIVDLAAEPRYKLGNKPPLAERFHVGDVVRVRLAPERKRDSDGDIALALELGPQAAMVVLDPLRQGYPGVGGRLRLSRWVASTAVSAPTANRDRPSNPSSTPPPSIPNDTPRPRSSTTAPRSSSCGSRRTTRRTTSAVPCACAWRWRIQSTPSPSNCCRTSAFSPCERWPRARESFRRCRKRWTFPWRSAPRPSRPSSSPMPTPRSRPAASRRNRAW